MKKLLLTSIATICIAVLSFAQATLPVSWGFPTTTLPTGFSSVGTFAYYSGSGNPAPAGKFSASGTILTVAFAGTPGMLSYDLVGNPPPSGTWAGVFRVEESADGTTWTTVGTDYTTLPTTYTTYTHALNSASRYVRFNFVTHTTGNVGLDNVDIAVGTSTTQQINVQQSAVTIVNGGTYALSSPVSTMLPTTFVIQNTGTVGTLNVSGVTITGPAAADYSVASFPSTVAPSSNGNMVINFTPSVSGSRIAAINIANNDPTATNYVINLYGVGGALATQPTAQGTALVFSGIKSYQFAASFTGASPAPEGYLVLRRTGSPVTDVPVDGVDYQRGDVIGNSKVVYSSNATAFYPNEIVASTNYYFAVFSYNGPGVYRNYLNTSPLTGMVTSAGSMQPPTYYNTISTANPTFVTDLHNLINPHTIQFYSDYGPLMVSRIYDRDTTAGQRVVTCVYSGENKVYTDPFDWTTEGYSREHSYCQSWQVTVNSPSFQSLPEYNDYHMITPTNQTLVNAVRSNYPYGIVVGTPLASSYLGDKIGNDINGHKVFEPRDSDKGDAARCMLYECICYTGVPYSGPANTNITYAPGAASWSLPATISSTIPYGQDQDVLKRWSYQDPPSNFEIARNDYVDSLQGNRNPFIDHPEYVCYIDFTTMSKIAGATSPCATAGVEDYQTNNDVVSLSPNPNNGSFVLNYSATKSQKVVVTLYDMVGRIIYNNDLYVNNGDNKIDMSIDGLTKGIYIFEFVTPAGKQTQKLVID
ncbi:MAG: endonuclease [Bacteroidia bacterium]